MFSSVNYYIDKLEGRILYRVMWYDQCLFDTIEIYHKVQESDFNYRHKIASIVAYGLLKLAKHEFYLPNFSIRSVELDQYKYPRIRVDQTFVQGEARLNEHLRRYERDVPEFRSRRGPPYDVPAERIMAWQFGKFYLILMSGFSFYDFYVDLDEHEFNVLVPPDIDWMHLSKERGDLITKILRHTLHRYPFKRMTLAELFKEGSLSVDSDDLATATGIGRLLKGCSRSY